MLLVPPSPTASPHRHAVQDSVDRLDGVSLAELDRAQLHDREESKVILNCADLPQAIERLAEQYLVLDHEDERLQRYRNDYLDTGDLANFREHHNQLGRRQKIRYRSYVNSDLTYFELKRSIHGRTVKERRRTAPLTGERMHAADATFFFKQTTMCPSQYSTSLTVLYDRVLLVKRDFSERVTIDFALTFEAAGGRVEIPDLAIVEFKQPKFDRRSPAIQAMQRRPQMFSKYCMGLASCQPDLRQNRFKKVFRSLDALAVTPSFEAVAA